MPGSRLGRVTVVLINFNSGRWLARSLNALKGQGGRYPEALVLDNASTDGSVEQIGSMPGLSIHRSEANIGFGRGVNWLLDRIKTDYLLILNPDCLLTADGLHELVAELDAHPQAAMASGRVFDMSGNEQRGSRRQLPGPRRVLNELFPFRGGAGIDLTHMPSPQQPTSVEAVSGACMLLRRSAFEQVGGFDPSFPMHFEDLDLMARLQAADWQIRLVPQVAISHAGGVSSRSRPVRVMLAKHRGLWRYLNKHCRNRWPLWSRPVWLLAIALHALVMTPVAWLWRRN
jgi:N-acetylglucosaminyl-diphospho-decaprenol L-rhamnosyltransferase